MIRTPKRQLQAHLPEARIESLIHYPRPPHPQAAYAYYAAATLPIADRLVAEVLSLPIGPHIDDSSVDAVLREVRRFHD